MKYDSSVHEGGSSPYYEGSSGERYFAWQNRDADLAGRIEARKFRPFINCNDVVLDFGCGSGRILKSIECARKLGVEINPVARMEAIKVGIECESSLSEIAQCSVDVAISNHALEHVLYPVAVVAKLREKLKVGGTLVVYLPIDDWRTQKHYRYHEINHHIHTWTPQLFGNLLVEAGFAEKEFSINIMTHAWFPGAARLYDRLPESIFDFGCKTFAFLVKRRQLVAVARRHS